MASVRVRALESIWIAAACVALACGGPAPVAAPPPDPTDRLDPAGLAARPDVGPDWFARVQRHIAEREYQVSGEGADRQAPNRVHDLRTYFDPTGIRVHDRTAKGSPELLLLSLAGVGRGESLANVAPGEVVVAEPNRVEIRRAGLVEWYENSSAGLEQGFTLAERPDGEGQLAVEVALAGARASLLGDAVVFETDSPRRKLRYGELVVVDAGDRKLAAHFELRGEGSRVRIVVDDDAAAYPIVIDPLLTATADALIQANQLAAQLGISVAGAGDVNGDGYADVIAGAQFYDAGQFDEGVAMIFHGSPTGPASGSVASASAAVESNQASSRFGAAVAGAGDVNGDGYDDVIVGAFTYDAGQSDEGAAFIFPGSASGIGFKNPASTGVTRLESDQVDAYLGSSVAGAGDVNGDGYDDVIVGAWAYDAGESDEGAAFVFLGGASGIPNNHPGTAGAQIESDLALANLGYSVAGAGDLNGDGYDDVIVGAPYYALAPVVGGAAFVYLGGAAGIVGGGPGAADTQLASEKLAYDGFGISVAGAGDVNGDGYGDVIVGADGFDDAEFNEGAAFVFHGSASGIPDATTATAATQLESNQAGGQLGASVAGAGDVNGDGFADVIVGAAWYDNPMDAEGAAFVFLGSPTGVADGHPATAFAQVESNQVGARFGTSVGGAGDVDGDGFADLIIGAYLYDAGIVDEGAAFVYFGGADGISDGTPATADSLLESDQINASFGTRVAGAGDVNGDGFDDVIVASESYDAGVYGLGAAFVFKGSANGIVDATPATAATQLVSDMPGVGLGYATVAGAGDVNGDGYGDVIVGSSVYPVGPSVNGAAFLYYGAATGFADGNIVSPVAKFESDLGGSAFGSVVAGAGDVNGDGYADVLVGDYLYSAGEPLEGAVFLLLGSASGIASGNPATPGVSQFESNVALANFGSVVAPAGDVDGDGYSDIIIAGRGGAIILRGGAAGIPSGPYLRYGAAVLYSSLGDDSLGGSAAGAGDVDGDGFDDVILGSTFYGEAYVVPGYLIAAYPEGVTIPTPLGSPVTTIQSDQSGSYFGWSVASAGDVNGDGYADVVVGAPDYIASPSPFIVGATFVFHGSASGIATDPASSVIAAYTPIQPNPGFGHWVSGAGDVDGDSYADVIVGAPSYRPQAGQTNAGSAFVYRGNGGAPGRLARARQWRADGSGLPVQPGGAVSPATGFITSLEVSHPDGAGRVRAEFEVCRSGLPFGDAACATASSPDWVFVDGATPDVTLSHTFANLVSDELYRWRARVLYAPTTGPIPSPPDHGRWRRPGGQTVTGDIRIVPEPGFAASWLAGIGLLRLLDRRRARRRRSVR